MVVYSADASGIQDAKYCYGTTVMATIYFNGTAVNKAVHKVLLTSDVPISGTDALGKSISVAAGTTYTNQAVAHCTITVPAHDATTMSLSYTLTITLSMCSFYAGGYGYDKGNSIKGRLNLEQ